MPVVVLGGCHAMLGHLHATLLDDSRVKISLWLAYPDLLVKYVVAS